MLGLYKLRPKPTIEGVARRNARKRKDAVFVHINKTAGSSLGAALGVERVHITAREWIRIIGREEWDRRFTFSFVRDPWSRVASQYRYRRQGNQTAIQDKAIEFNDWIRLSYGKKDPVVYDNPLMFADQALWLYDNDGIAVDFVGRFERLQEDFGHIAKRLGLKTELPWLRSTSSNPNADVRDQYDEDTYEIIAKHYQRDLDLFGYEA